MGQPGTLARSCSFTKRPLFQQAARPIEQAGFVVTDLDTTSAALDLECLDHLEGRGGSKGGGIICQHVQEGGQVVHDEREMCIRDSARPATRAPAR